MTRRRKQNTNIQKVIQKLFREFWKLAASFTNSVLDWLMRGLLVTRTKEHRQTAKAGFILPTVTMLLLVVALVIGAILFRTGSRTNQVINERNQQVIYNAATPAIDRAKAKLEFLFKRDERLPNSVPPEAQLMSALLNDGQNNIRQLPDNPYRLPDETEIQLNGQTSPAWRYQTDVDGDGQKETVAYSIILKTQDPLDNNSPSVRRESSNNKDKANKLVVRNGPITAQRASDPACDRLNLAPNAGWDFAGSGSLRKTFQVTAVVVSNKVGNRTVTTLEFQQDRELALANRWGAWTRYDLSLYPFPPFRWNGAMHTEGSLFLGGFNADSVQNYLISAPKSCLYNPESNSEISIGRVKNNANQIEFAGQVARGSIAGNGAQDATIHVYGDPPITNNTISEGTDSVQSNVSASTAEQMALNPVVLFTEDKSRSVSTANNASNTGVSTSDWLNREQLPGNTRIVAKTEKPPYVDDTYRADDRIGPKPTYDLEGVPDVVLGNNGLKNGINITNGPGLSGEQKEQLTRTEPKPNDVELRTLGLDGYWERRARAEGLRIIVGPRLELGNPFGWGNRDLDGNGTVEPIEYDPLYPVYQSNLPNGIPHLQQQRRTLRDNLAAVQATAVYHYTQGNNGYFPVACVATTAHPGTQVTNDRSKNFRITTQSDGAANPARYVTNGTSEPFYSDFFTGLGTNGWEHNIAPEGDFRSGSLRKALENLANFAGDYEDANRSGAFPPTQEGGRVHPDPYLTMWGNFSNLKRAIKDPATNPLTGQDSIADQSYLHTAGCALGMLAYNIDYFNDYSYGNSGDLTNLQTEIRNLFDSDTTNGNITLNASGLVTSLTTRRGTALVSTANPPVPLTPDLLIAALDDPSQEQQQRLARFIVMKEQIARDRKYGFAPSNNPSATGTFNPNPSTATPPPTPPADKILPSSLLSQECSDASFSGLSVSSAPVNALRLLCPTQPKFPSLYYIFPTTGHGNRNSPNISPGNTGSTADSNEPYIQRTGSISVDFGGFKEINNGELNDIAGKFRPKNSGGGGWILPTGGSSSLNTGNTDADNAFRVRDPGGSDLHVPFIDKGIFDGREMMSLRVLDIDLERLRQGSNNVGNGDRWFPRSGIFYAFREDAFREDSIARPSGGAYTDPTNPVRTRATDPGNATDPEVNTTTGISPKPVDFYPDPDRRPYGFRLRNGTDLRRETNNPRGITFVSDNVVAIQGDFNLHTQEEFQETLSDDFSNFYTRQSLNTNFATLNGDNWRPAEILSDAIMLLSRDFTDGNIEVGFRNDGRHSYRGLGTPSNEPWVREDNSSNNAATAAPVKIFRDGNPRRCTSGVTIFCQPGQQQAVSPNVDFGNNGRRGNLNEATNDTRINATMVSGVIPSRQNQGNGGFHNFPHLLETWAGRNLRIAGSFIQLNFSTSATGPYDQDAWEPTETPNGNENSYHFQPPNRRWGYDVGLQYAPAGPLSRRFITAETPRSEFYEELAANDPYICNLRRAIATNNAQDRTEDITQVNQECQ